MVSLEARFFNSGLSGEKGCLVKMEMKPLMTPVRCEGREGPVWVLVQMGLGVFDEAVRFLVKTSERSAFGSIGFVDFQRLG